MGFWSGLGKIGLGIGSLAAAPWSGGASLALLGPLAAGGSALAGGIGDLIGGGADDPRSPTDPSRAALQSVIGDLQQTSRASRAKGTELSGIGADTLAPVLQYFQSLIGGDPQALLQATRPERSRVMDQYDAARLAVSQSSPRGGGTNAVLAQSRFAEASDVANLTATARRDATTQAANLGTTLTGLGLSADQLASQDLGTVLNGLLAAEGIDVSRAGLDLTKRGQNMQTATGIGEALGTLLGLMLTRQQTSTGGA